LNHDWFTCQLQRAEFLWKGSHKGPLFRMFTLSLESIISNQMRPRRLRGAWFSRLLRYPARRWSGSILSPGTHTDLNTQSTSLDVDSFDMLHYYNQVLHWVLQYHANYHGRRDYNFFYKFCGCQQKLWHRLMMYFKMAHAV